MSSGRLEGKDLSVVAFLDSGILDYIDGGVFRTRRNRAHNRRRTVWHAIDTRTDIGYDDHDVGSASDGFSVSDSEGFDKSLGKRDSRHSVYWYLPLRLAWVTNGTRVCSGSVYCKNRSFSIDCLVCMEV